MMKFSAKFSLINVSVEFEDEPDWRNSSRDIAKIFILPYGLLYENRLISAFITFSITVKIKPQLLYTIQYRVSRATKWYIKH